MQKRILAQGARKRRASLPGVSADLLDTVHKLMTVSVFQISESL